jgi:hypothetical protein
VRTLEAAWERVLDEVGRPNASRLRQLPTRLGLPRSWSSFARLGPIRQLPAWLGPDDPRVRAPYDEAHFRAGFWGLTSDRVADGQAQVTRAELSTLLAAWRRALARCGLSPAAARHLVESSRTAFDEGIQRERLLLAHGGSLVDYRASLRLRTHWFGVSGLEWVRASGLQPLSDFRDGIDVLMLGLQLADDAVDAAEDTNMRGRSFPSALGLAREAMLALASLTLLSAAAHLARAGSRRLSRWCAGRASRVRGIIGSPLSELGWAVFAAPLLERLEFETGGPRSGDQRRATSKH